MRTNPEKHETNGPEQSLVYGKNPVTELLKNAGLTTPFEESCLRGVSEAAKAWLDSYDLTGIV